jgi:hypothetical protein
MTTLDPVHVHAPFLGRDEALDSGVAEAFSAAVKLPNPPYLHYQLTKVLREEAQEPVWKGQRWEARSAQCLKTYVQET